MDLILKKLFLFSRARPERVEGFERSFYQDLNMQNHFYLYILKCVNGAYYVGHTDNIDQRMSEHYLGLIDKCYTKNKRPVELVFVQNFSTRDDAFQAERQVKGWSRNKKEAFIEGNWDKIKELNLLQKKTIKSAQILQQVQDERSEEGMGSPMECSVTG